MTPYEAGRAARREGKSVLPNPILHEYGNDNCPACEWHAGWHTENDSAAALSGEGGQDKLKDTGDGE